MEHVRVFWDAISPGEYLRVFDAWGSGQGEIFLRMTGETEWTRLCQILDLSTGVVEDGQSDERGEDGEGEEEQGGEGEGDHGDDA